MSISSESPRPPGIPGSAVPGPWPVGAYAAKLRERLSSFAHVQVFGEVVNFRIARSRAFWELRDATGALPCSMWRNEYEALGLVMEDGMQVVAAGGCDYYPGSRTASPSFTFSVRDLRVAGEGDLLAQIAQLRRVLDAEGLFEPQKRLPRPALPRVIGVVTGEAGKARDDVLAGLRRRGWEGRLVWAFAPVQDRQAAPRITRALQDLAACPEVEVVIVARGGGSLSDLLAFCDETLCRTVAMLRVPIISSVGHHTDRTLLDDVAAVSCSTPTHAAESAVPVDVAAARASLVRCAGRLDALGRRAIVERARRLALLAGRPSAHVGRERARLHQHLREIRAASRRAVGDGTGDISRRALVLTRKGAATSLALARGRSRALADAAGLARAAALARRRTDLERLAATLAAHDPQRTLERGYARLEDTDGTPVTTAATARRQPRLRVVMADDALIVRPEETP